MVNEKNAKATKIMLERIVERSGEDRASVFLDIIIDTIFHKGDINIWSQQQAINHVAETYGLISPALTYRATEEVPF